MTIAKIFRNGSSQAIRLPKEFRFLDDEVYLKKVGHAVIIYPKDQVWQTFMHGLTMFSDDYLIDGREQDALQKREEL